MALPCRWIQLICPRVSIVYLVLDLSDFCSWIWMSFLCVFRSRFVRYLQLDLDLGSMLAVTACSEFFFSAGSILVLDRDYATIVGRNCKTIVACNTGRRLFFPILHCWACNSFGPSNLARFWAWAPFVSRIEILAGLVCL
uniref:Uncharacterized protein n=1 Tax=Aegilops tauschii subsp. strangulata TaxID=200361 RepID=A0A452ZTV8_AEGTS